MDKVVASPGEAVADIANGATIAIAGFSVGHRFATSLILALRDKGTKDLTLVCNSLEDPGATRGQILAENGQVKKLVAAFSARPGAPTASEEQIAAGTMASSGNILLLRVKTPPDAGVPLVTRNGSSRRPHSCFPPMPGPWASSRRIGRRPG